MTFILTDFSEDKLIRAIEDSYVEYGAVFGRSPLGELYDRPDMMRFTSGIPIPLRNGVMRAHLKDAAADEKIENTINHFKARSLSFMWLVGPSSRPADLGKRLEAHGFLYVFDAPGMAADLLALDESPSGPPELVIKTVTDDETLRHFTVTFNLSFGLPETGYDAFFEGYKAAGIGADLPHRHYVGYLDGEPVATSTVVMGAGVAGIYGVGTLPQARRKGIGAVMTLAPLREARETGYRIGVLHSSPEGLSVYQKLGFKEYCKLGIYLYGDDAGLFAH